MIRWQGMSSVDRVASERAADGARRARRADPPRDVAIARRPAPGDLARRPRAPPDPTPVGRRDRPARRRPVGVGRVRSAMTASARSSSTRRGSSSGTSARRPRRLEPSHQAGREGLRGGHRLAGDDPTLGRREMERSPRPVDDPDDGLWLGVSMPWPAVCRVIYSLGVCRRHPSPSPSRSACPSRA